MIRVYRNDERRQIDAGWLKSRHSFNSEDPSGLLLKRFRSLRVIADDHVAPASGFGGHSHRDMEILSYVLEGVLVHSDGLGHSTSLGRNAIQKISAGSGIVHSEFNGSKTDPVHFLQIWIDPRTKDAAPSYEQQTIRPEERRDRFRLIASPEGRSRSIKIDQDARVFVADISAGYRLTYPILTSRFAWLHVMEGTVTLNGTEVTSGDGAAVEDEEILQLIGVGPSQAEVMLFDLA